jgi:hypothetical protein
MTDLTIRRVAPFGHLGINACVPLPRAYRSLPRPSSPLCAQASPTCLRSLDHIICGKQSTRDLRVTIVCKIVAQCRFTNPRSTIFRCQTALTRTRPEQGPGSRCRLQNQSWSGCRDGRRTVWFSIRRSTRRSVKEVIQPQVPLRLPCYDFAPVTTLAFGRLVPCGFRHGLRALAASMA